MVGCPSHTSTAARRGGACPAMHSRRRAGHPAAGRSRATLRPSFAAGPVRPAYRSWEAGREASCARRITSTAPAGPVAFLCPGPDDERSAARPAGAGFGPDRRPANRGARARAARARGRHGLRRGRLRGGRRGRRGPRRQHEPDRVPGGLHRPVVRRSGGRDDIPADRQLRAAPRGRPVRATVAPGARRGDRHRGRARGCPSARRPPPGRGDPRDRRRRYARARAPPPGARLPPRDPDRARRDGSRRGGCSRPRRAPLGRPGLRRPGLAHGSRRGRRPGRGARLPARRDRGFRPQGEHRAEPATTRRARSHPALHRDGRDGARAGGRRRRALARSRRPGPARRPGRAGARGDRRRPPAARDLPWPPDRGARRRRRDPAPPVRPSRREPSRPGRRDGPGPDDCPEPRGHRGRRHAPRRWRVHREPGEPERWLRGGTPQPLAPDRDRAVPPRRSARAPGRARRLRPLRGRGPGARGVQGVSEAPTSPGAATRPRPPKPGSVLIIGSGPVVIGQAAEFDYAGTQACRALRADGVRTILVNSNPATIMTDPTVADAVYLEPLTVAAIEAVIAREKPDGLLAGLGGQTALNLTMALAQAGVLERHGVRLLGTPLRAIEMAEDRLQFRDLLDRLGQPYAPSAIVEGATDAERAASIERALTQIGLPAIIRPAFTLGGTGGGIVETEADYREGVRTGLRASPIHQVMVEQCLVGWQEIEYEVMRDHEDTCIAVCSMENVDPLGVHTGDSIGVAPVQTLPDPVHQRLRSAALAIIRGLGVEGGCNVQFALSPDSRDYAVIEVNPRVSRSSALASKATGYPIARVAAQI